jgi:hypothetical protein
VSKNPASETFLVSISLMSETRKPALELARKKLFSLIYPL